MCVNKVVILVVCGLSLSFAANAAIYQWTDSSGNVHYSDQPGTNDAKPVDIQPQPQDTGGDSDVIQRTQALIEKQKQDKEQSQKDQAKQADIDKQNAYNTQVNKLCETSKGNLKLLQETGRRVYTVDAKGEYHYFDDNERAAETTRLEAQIKQYCH